MYQITRNDFEDEISQIIFDYRKKYYEEKNMDYILKLVCKMHGLILEKVKRFNQMHALDLQKIENINKKIVIFGAGFKGKQLMGFLEEQGLSHRIYAFIDNDKNKQQTLLYEKEIISLEIISKSIGEYFVLIPFGSYMIEMKKILFDIGFSANQIMEVIVSTVQVDDLENSYHYEELFFDKNKHFVVYGTEGIISEQIFSNMLRRTSINFDGIFVVGGECEKQISDAIEQEKYFIVLDRWRKKELLDKGVRNQNILYFVPQMDYFQYFDLPVHKKGMDEVFIDGGSFDLQTSFLFYQWCQGECSKIYAFECLNKGIELCKRRLEEDNTLAKITQIIPKGLWSDSIVLYFAEDIDFGTASKIVNKVTEKKVEVTSIDEVLHGDRVTFIKMDIEGSELEALKGARESIKKWHPTLAISAYHKREDIITLPALIKEIEPNYKLYLRCYHEEETEVVLYGIWQE